MEAAYVSVNVGYTIASEDLATGWSYANIGATLVGSQDIADHLIQSNIGVEYTPSDADYEAVYLNVIAARLFIGWGIPLK